MSTNMQSDFLHRKTPVLVRQMPQNGGHLLFVDEEWDDGRIQDVNISRSLFVRLGLRETIFSRCRLTQNIFEDCYFRHAQFTNVDFSGSSFRDCNLEKAKFRLCILRYMRFSRCVLDYEDIIGGLPLEPVLRIQMLNALKQNAIEMGEKKMADRLLLLAIESEKVELRNRFWIPNNWYRERYSGWSVRSASFFKWLSMRVSDLLSGYGLKPLRLILWALFFVVCVAVLIVRLNLPYLYADESTLRTLSLPEALFVSAVTFGIGVGGYVPMSLASQFLSIVERFLGIVFLGFLVATVYRRIAR